MRQHPRPQLLILAALVAAAPAAADWLVTRDGGRIETRGAWKVAGRQVLFTQPNGTLSSIRLDQVDLDLSATETQRALQAATAPPAPPAAKPEPVLRLTDKDLPPVREADEDTAAAGADKAEKKVSSGLEVGSWERAASPGGDGIEIFGSVKNSGSSNVTSPTLMVTLYDGEGRLIATAEGRVNAAAVPPGQTASFRVVFPGVDDFAAARFDPQGMPFASRTEDGAEGGEGAAGGAVDEGQAPESLDQPPAEEAPSPEPDGTDSGAAAEPPPAA